MINVNLINSIIKRKLYLCGWNETINYDINDVVETLRKEGYCIFPYAEEILHLFLNTEIIFSLSELKKCMQREVNAMGIFVSIYWIQLLECMNTIIRSLYV